MQRCDDVDAAALRALPQHRALPMQAFEASPERHTTPFNQIFGNRQLVRFTCSVCNATTPKTERVHTLELSLAKPELRTLEALIDEHFKEERLDKNFRCQNEHCRVLGHGVKNVDVLHWPPVLAVTLKRFQFSAATGVMRKIKDAVSFPLILPTADGVDYRLRALIVHRGDSPGGGHYVAYVRASNDSWYFCNDSMQPQVVQYMHDVAKQQAYMLMYERRQ